MSNQNNDKQSRGSEVGDRLPLELAEQALLTPGVQVLSLSSSTGKFEVEYEVGDDQKLHKVNSKE